MKNINVVEVVVASLIRRKLLKFVLPQHAGDKTNHSIYYTARLIFGRGVESSPAHTEELVTTTLYCDLSFHGSVHVPLGPVVLSV